MNEFKCDDTNKIVEFDTLEELFKIREVKHWTQWSDFHRFSLNGNNLVVELDRGANYYSIGTLKSLDGINLPKFNFNYYTDRYQI